MNEPPLAADPDPTPPYRPEYPSPDLELRALLDRVHTLLAPHDNIRKAAATAERALAIHTPDGSDGRCVACSIPPVVVAWPCALVSHLEAMLRASLEAGRN